MNKIIVFDFDKTLTSKDTNLDFFLFAGKHKKFFVFRILMYFCFLILRKIKLISNLRLKNFGVILFLKNITESEFSALCNQFSKTIELNRSIQKLLLEHSVKGDRVLVITASLAAYVQPIFPEIEVIGSELNFNVHPVNIGVHCHGQNKVEHLNKLNITKIDVLYTDSISDLPMARISTQINLVNKRGIQQFSTVEQFILTLEQ